MTSSDPGPTNWGWVAVVSAAAAKVKKPSALPWSSMTGVKALSWKSSALRRPSWEWSDWLSFQYLFLYFSASSTCQDIFPSTRCGVNQGADQSFQPTTIQIHNYHLCDKNYVLYIWVHKLTLWRFKIQKKIDLFTLMIGTCQRFTILCEYETRNTYNLDSVYPWYNCCLKGSSKSFKLPCSDFGGTISWPKCTKDPPKDDKTQPEDGEIDQVWSNYLKAYVFKVEGSLRTHTQRYNPCPCFSIASWKRVEAIARCPKASLKNL